MDAGDGGILVVARAGGRCVAVYRRGAKEGVCYIQ